MSAWSRQAASPATPSVMPVPPCLQYNAHGMTSAARCRQTLYSMQPFGRARLLSARSPGSGDWLSALSLSLSPVGLNMENATVRIAVGLRFGAPLVRSHVCICGITVNIDGQHGLSCRHGSFRHSRHSQLNDLLSRAFISAGTSATREPVTVHQQRQTTGWSHYGALVERSMFGVGCYLPRHAVSYTHLTLPTILRV